LKIKLGKNQPKPEYQSKGAAGFDLCATENIVLTSAVRMMDLDIAIELPQNHVGLLICRSSMAKKGIALANGTGVIDSDFTGNIKAPLVSDACGGTLIQKGDRIVQLLVMPVNQVSLEVVDELTETERGAGGFGSTDRRGKY
jgi:dUTP pyrophosphatase